MIRIVKIKKVFQIFILATYAALQLLPGLAGASGLTADQNKVFNLGANYYDVDSCGTSPDTSNDTGARAYILGDSITERSQTAYTNAFNQDNISVNIDASSGRGLDKKGTSGNKLSGLDAIDQDSGDIKQADIIIVALGTNGGTDKDNIKKAVDAIRKTNNSAPIYWVDTFVLDRDSYNHDVIAPANKAIYDSSGDENYKVISWFTAVDSDDDPQKPSGKEKDPNSYIDNSDGLGVHPTTTGSKALADLVSEAVSSSASPDNSGSGQALCCGGGTTDDGGSTNLTGSDNAEKTWNYFKGKGLSDEQTAGIMGNMQQESHFDPQILQVGGRSKSPSDAKDLGWGIIQWSGNGTNGHSTADKFNSLYEQSGLTGKKYELATQLDLVWDHMKNKPPITRGDFSIDDFKKIKDEREATLYFTFHIEAGTDPGGIREDYATDLLHQYAGKSGGGGDSDPAEAAASASDCGSNSAGSPECGTATGNAKILCEAKKYDPVSYVWSGGHAGGAAYHRACTDLDSSHDCGLDCSGLVSVAVYDVYNSSGSWDTNSLRSDTHSWKEISFDDVQAGDVIEPEPSHVEIIDHVTGNTIYTFGAHTANTDQPKQVGPAQFKKSDGQRYYRYIGAGT